MIYRDLLCFLGIYNDLEGFTLIYRDFLISIGIYYDLQLLGVVIGIQAFKPHEDNYHGNLG